MCNLETLVPRLGRVRDQKDSAEGYSLLQQQNRDTMLRQHPRDAKMLSLMTYREPLPITMIRGILTKLGALTSSGQMYWIERVTSQLEVGHWFRANGICAKPLYATRQELYAALAHDIADKRVLYLEFGVFQGASLCAWSQLLRNPRSCLHGFDSFEGLPERWNAFNDRGKFDTNGVLPRIDDPRVTLHVGGFHQTLPHFTLPPHEQLIVHVDCDLYSSTKYVLDALKCAIRPGAILLFDEFYDYLHELRAFSEFLEAGNMKFVFLGGATSFSQCAFQRIS